jgi:D-alanyl-D-alanine carboxypeptidase (penicillin-binding protein 5/6)
LPRDLTKAVSGFLAALILCAEPAFAADFESKAPHAILIDFESGSVLYEKAADERFAPASMTKLMTAEIVFGEIAAKRLSYFAALPISEHAWRHGGAPSGGSAMFAEIHSQVTVADLLRGMIIQSGNDAAIALAEGVAGSEPAFVDRMNARARELGLTGSQFRNANGWPDPEQYVTARDLALLARHIIATYPNRYPIFSEPEFTWNKIYQKNRNPLVGTNGIDGLKTGYIKASGYGMTVSAASGEQRLVAVVAGLASTRERDTEAARILDWGFRSFEPATLFDTDTVIGEASVYGGAVGRVPLKAKGEVRALLPRGGGAEIRARIVYQGPLMAPVEANARAGDLKIYDGERLIQSAPLYTADAVARGSLNSRAFDALGALLLGWL